MALVDAILDALLDLAEAEGPLVPAEAMEDPDELEQDLVIGLDLLEIVLFGGPADELDAEQLARHIDRGNPGLEILEALYNSSEEQVLVPLKEEEVLTPENVEGPLSEFEGGIAGLAISLNLLVAAIDSIPGLDIDAGTEQIAKILSFDGADGLIGREIDATLQEGVDPALKQKVHVAHRSKQADFQDFVEANLRQKATDPDIDPRDEPVGEGIRDLLHPNDLGFLAEPEEYGTRPGQEGLYELDALKVNEPEEIIEEPIQYGIPVPLRPVEQITALAGQPEDVKEIYRQVIDQLPKSENLIQD